MKIRYSDKQLEQETRVLLFEYLNAFNKSMCGDSNQVKPKNIRYKPQINKDNVITFMRTI